VVIFQTGEHGSPLQNSGKFVPFIKFDLTYNLYRYLRADDIRPYFKHKKSARQFNLRTVLPTYIFTYLHFFKK